MGQWVAEDPSGVGVEGSGQNPRGCDFPRKRGRPLARDETAKIRPLRSESKSKSF